MSGWSVRRGIGLFTVLIATAVLTSPAFDEGSAPASETPAVYEAALFHMATDGEGWWDQDPHERILVFMELRERNVRTFHPGQARTALTATDRANLFSRIGRMTSVELVEDRPTAIQDVFDSRGTVSIQFTRALGAGPQRVVLDGWFFCGGLCEHLTTLVLEKVDGEWEVTSDRLRWIS